MKPRNTIEDQSMRGFSATPLRLNSQGPWCTGTRSDPWTVSLVALGSGVENTIGGVTLRASVFAVVEVVDGGILGTELVAVEVVGAGIDVSTEAS
jgi:hypothetical protein